MSALPDLIQALLDPRIYPEPPRRVDLVQTQMSFLLIGDDFVYKIKKPVNLGYLDYSTLEQRRLFCDKEVELNRRLCPEIYLGVIPITRSDHSFQLGNSGEAVEYAVKMRRLPRERMMDVLLDRDGITPDMIDGLARKLAGFHSKSATGPGINLFGGLDTIVQNTSENFSQTDKYVGRTITEAKYRRIKDYTEDFIRRNRMLFQKRVNGGRIRDCHGDLHAAHICFQDGICVYDCIEFNDRFRYCDVASEIAFLAMDLDHYGRADLSRHFVRGYIRESGDGEIDSLLRFYKCYRAYVRGKVEGFKLDDPYISLEEKERTQAQASSYFDLAASYTRSKPLLLITAGLMGTGKSTLAAALAKRLGLVVISSDVTRKRLAGVPARESHFDEFNTGLYSADLTKQTYDAMFAEAKSILAEGMPVLLDASFSKAADRDRAREVARQADADFLILECVLDVAEVKHRLEERVKLGSVSDGRWEIYTEQKRRFEPVTEAEKHIVVDMAGDVEDAVGRVLKRIE